MNASTIIQHATYRAESIRVPTNDERRAEWAAKYFAQGHHRRPEKPRVRVPAVVGRVLPVALLAFASVASARDCSPRTIDDLAHIATSWRAVGGARGDIASTLKIAGLPDRAATAMLDSIYAGETPPTATKGDEPAMIRYKEAVREMVAIGAASRATLVCR